jgi:hypothetical protein
MTISPLTRAVVCTAMLLASFAAGAAEREIFFNDARVDEHSIAVIERSYDVRFQSGRYWHDCSSGLWGTEGGGPEGRIAAGLHLGGPTPAHLAASDAAPLPEADADFGVGEAMRDDEMSGAEVGELVGGLLGLMVLGEMMEQAEEA